MIPSPTGKRITMTLSKEELDAWMAERRAEKAALKAKVAVWKKEIRQMPELKEMNRLKQVHKDIMKWSRTTEFLSGEDADYADDEEEMAYEEMRDYKEQVYLPALEKHPHGPSYIAAIKRLEELKLY